MDNTRNEYIRENTRGNTEVLRTYTAEIRPGMSTLETTREAILRCYGHIRRKYDQE